MSIRTAARSAVLISMSAALLGTIVSCGPNTLAVRSEAEGSRVLLDGQEAAAGKPRSLPYFGTFVARLDPKEGPSEPYVRSSEQRSMQIDPPVPGWLFPLDLPLEALHRLLHGPRAHEIMIPSKLVSGAIVGATPPRLPELRERAEQLRTKR